MNHSRRRTGVPCLLALGLAALVPGPGCAETQTVSVGVEFVDRAGIGRPTLESTRHNPASRTSSFEGASAAGADETVGIDITASPGRALTIHVEAHGNGSEAGDFSCSYGDLIDVACGAAGVTGTTVESGTLKIGAGPSHDGGARLSSGEALTVTLAYQ